MSKKAQAILPFFALQLVAVIIFLIVLLTILTMYKNVKFTANEFDENMQSLTASRRLTVSTDCFAAEIVETIYNSETNRFVQGQRPLPGVIDINKLNDLEFFNCMRKDRYDLEAEVRAGVWDARDGSGGVFKYAIAVYDLTTKKYVYNRTNARDSDFDKYTMSSMVARVNKYENTECTTASAGKCSYEGYDCVGDAGDPCHTPPVTSENAMANALVMTSESIYSMAGGDYDDISCKEGRCENEADKDPPWEIRPAWIIKSPEYTFGTVQIVDATPYKNTASYTQFTDNCMSGENTIMPIVLKVGNEYHTGIFMLKTCLVKGAKYKFDTGFDATVKPDEESGCVGG